jgi:curli biogenesis system outer membrane secretion channel CsgG
MKIHAIWALPLLFAPILSVAQARKRVVILPFDDRNAGQGMMLGNVHVGARISDELISKLTAMGTFEIIDQEHLNAVIQEQNQGYGDRFSATGAAKLGKLVNADVLIFGEVDSLSATTKNENKGNVFAQKQVQTGIVDITVTARVIAVETGTIMTAPSATSEQTEVLSTRTSSAIPIIGPAATNNGMPVYGNEWAPKQEDKAIDDVTSQLSQKVSTSITSLQVAAPTPTVPKFVGIEDGLVVINKGHNAGIKVGDKFNIVRPTDTGLQDPDTNQPIIRKKKLCTMTVTIVEDTISSGTCDGSTLPQKGDELLPAQ